MNDAHLSSIDPVIEEPTPAQLEAEMTDHVQTYNGFVHLSMWFIFHAILLLLGIYFMTLGGSMAGGVVLAVAGVGVLIYGIVTTLGTRA